MTSNTIQELTDGNFEASVSQADHRVDDLASFEHEERWDGSDAEASGGQGVLVDVQLTDDDPAA